MPIPMWHPGFFGQNTSGMVEEEEVLEEEDDFHNRVESPLVMPDGELRFFGGEHGISVPFVPGNFHLLNLIIILFCNKVTY